MYYTKLYIKKKCSKADKNGMVSGRLDYTSSKNWNIKLDRNLDFNPEFSSWSKMFFHPKNLKSEKKTLCM